MSDERYTLIGGEFPPPGQGWLRPEVRCLVPYVNRLYTRSFLSPLSPDGGRRFQAIDCYLVTDDAGRRTTPTGTRHPIQMNTVLFRK
jgi:hypothetical protein